MILKVYRAYFPAIMVAFASIETCVAQLGKTEEQCDAKYGTPYLVLPEGLARRYKTEDYDITCGFMYHEENKAMEVRVQPLERDEIDANKTKVILEENSEKNNFKRTGCRMDSTGRKIYEKYEEPESGRVALYYLEDDQDPTGFTKKGTLRIQTKKYQDFVIQLGADIARAKAAATPPLPEQWANYKAEPYSQELIKRLDAGDPKFQCDMGWWCFNGYHGLPVPIPAGGYKRRIFRPDANKAAEWFNKSALQGNAQAQKMLGDMYILGVGVNKDEKEGLRLILKAAEQGLADAQYELWSLFLHGIKENLDEKRAFEWCLKAAEQGHAKAQIGVGGCYRKGTGVEKDSKEGIKWYFKAAEQGDSKAQESLGCFYMYGDGVDKDESEGIKWFTKSAEQGNSGAQGSLGSCYIEGRGVTKDEKEGVKWLLKAAEQGNEQWQWFLGTCYELGRGVPKSYEEAVKWFSKSVEKGNQSGQISLGDCYKNGWGVSKDEKEAAKWYAEAANAGNPLAKRKLQEIESKIK